MATIDPINRAPIEWALRRRLVGAWRALTRMDVTKATAILAEIEQLGCRAPDVPASLSAAVRSLQAALLVAGDDPAAALSMAHQLQAHAPTSSLTTLLLRAGYWKTGRLTEFHELRRQPSEPTRRAWNAVPVIFDQCLDAIVEFEKNRPAVASRLAERALQHARQSVGGDSPAALLPATLLAQISYEQGRVEEADSLLRYRMPAIRAVGLAECAVRAYPLLARISMHRNQRDQAVRTLQEAQSVGEKRGWRRLVVVALGEQLRIELDEANLPAARACYEQLLQQLRHPCPDRSPHELCELRLHRSIAHLRMDCSNALYDKVITALSDLQIEAATSGSLYCALQLKLQLIDARILAGDERAARQGLIDALHVGAANGLSMIFADAGCRVRGAIVSLMHEPTEGDSPVLDLLPYLRTLPTRARNDRQPAPQRRASAARRSLTLRENGILRLIARGLSNKRIARSLDITPETVKTHTKSIFLKLAAQTRAQAVARAEALGVL
jgi:LuxR family maltose regulon positive regulatory protein